MIPIVLLEGVNGVGKSTLAERLRKDLDGVVFKPGIPQGDPEKWFLRQLKTIVRAQAEDRASPVIVDRLHWSNVVYNGEEGGAVLTPAQFNEVEAYLNEVGAILILLVDDPQDVAVRLQEQRSHDWRSSIRYTRRKLGEKQDKLWQLIYRSPLQALTLNLRQLVLETGEATPAYDAILKIIKEGQWETECS